MPSWHDSKYHLPRLSKRRKHPVHSKLSCCVQGFDGITPWSNPNGIARINGLKNRNNALAIYIDDLLELELEGDFEKELIADPPVHFINFKINKLATGRDVHGVSDHLVFFAIRKLEELVYSDNPNRH
jgi:hypothetical protein